MSLRLRILVFLAALLIVSVLGLSQPWPAVIVVVAYLLLIFPLIEAR